MIFSFKLSQYSNIHQYSICIKINIYQYVSFRLTNWICPSSEWWDKLLLFLVIENMWFVVIMSRWHKAWMEIMYQTCWRRYYQFPVKVNPYGDTRKYCEIDESSTIMNKLSSLKNSVKISQLTRGTKVFSTDGSKDISSAQCQLNRIGIMSVPPYILVVGNFFREELRPRLR